ncbi:phosphatidylglycerophosphatase A [Desulfobacterota bacterium AH_259_B03_O07]|nr:phosphatidylglycerophosphatase A [Desulfobacterota bacterium AH_259_B03_O07]
MKANFAKFFATFFYLGYSPFAPGTVGTLGAIVLYYFLFFFSDLAYLFFTILFIIFSIWISNEASSARKDPDPGWVVIDEVCGYLVTMFLIPYSITNIFLGFLFFRFFDILKPPPIRRFESLPGGLGIVTDDVIAGIYANIILQILNNVMS